MDIDAMQRQLTGLMQFKARVEPLLPMLEAMKPDYERYMAQRAEDDAEDKAGGDSNEAEKAALAEQQAQKEAADKAAAAAEEAAAKAAEEKAAADKAAAEEAAAKAAAAEPDTTNT